MKVDYVENYVNWEFVREIVSGILGPVFFSWGFWGIQLNDHSSKTPPLNRTKQQTTPCKKHDIYKP